MDFELSDAERELLETTAETVRRELNPLLPLDGSEAAFRRAWRAALAIGAPGLVVPTAEGGGGRSPLEAALVLESFGRSCDDFGFVFSIAAHLLAGATPIGRFGTEAQRRRHLPGLCDGRTIAAFAATERGGGSDLGSIAATAVADGEGFRLDGTKTFVTNAPVADLFVVIVATDPAKGTLGGLGAFVLERGLAGLETSALPPMLGHRSTPLGEIAMSGVRVGADALLGTVGAGSQVFQEAMNWERTLLFAAHVGLMERILERAVREAKTRKVGGASLGSRQALSHRLADAKARLEAARLLVRRAAAGLGKRRSVALDASIAKLFVGESLLELANGALRVAGARGYVDSSPEAEALRDAIGATIYSGTSEIQREFIARWLGL